MKFTEKTIKRLAEIGITESKYEGQYFDKGATVIVTENSTGPNYVAISVLRHEGGADKHTLRYMVKRALKLAEQAEKIIKENGK